MLRGEQVLLRALERSDIETLAGWGQVHEDWPLVNIGPYAPRAASDALRDFDAPGSETHRATENRMPFAIVAQEQLVGGIALWNIDAHNRSAHLGISLGPDFRGNGYGTDACRVLLAHAFNDRGLHRVQLEVLADNERAIRSYRSVGFVEEGRRRGAAWVNGQFADELVFSVLAPEWASR